MPSRKEGGVRERPRLNEAKARVISLCALSGAAAGLALAAAYCVRYTQVLAGPGLAAAAWFGIRDARRRWAFLIGFGAAAVAGALPDVAYRMGLYGAPWRFGTGELRLFGVGALPEAVGRVGGELLAWGEWGWLWPLALVGAGYAWRRSRRALVTMLAAYGPPLVFHLWYPFLRLRDLLWAYAPLAALTALGGVVVLGWLWGKAEGGRRKAEGGSQKSEVRRQTVECGGRGTLAGATGGQGGDRGNEGSHGGLPLGGWGRAGLVGVVLALGMARAGALWERGPGFYTFGALLPEQRRALEQLAVLTEPGAVVACSLNSGAVELYGQRLAVRPGGALQPEAAWSSEQWLRFVRGMQAQGRTVYVLMDSPEMEAPLRAAREALGVEAAGTLAVPVYDVGGGAENRTVRLYRVGP